jgi:hypothetical protein
VAAHDWATWHHNTFPLTTTCKHPIRPRVYLATSSHANSVVWTCHMSQYNSSTCHPSTAKSASLPHHLYRMYGQLPRQHCTDYTVNKNLLVWKNEQNVISFTYSVCLSPFKLRWVHNDEAYAHIRFEAIMSTLIFRPS